MIVAYEIFRKGFSKLDINGVELKNDLDSNCVVIVEEIQTILRKYGVENAYELCKDLSRNNDCINMNKIKDFIERLPIDEKIKKLYEIDVENYIGKFRKNRFIIIYLTN